MWLCRHQEALAAERETSKSQRQLLQDVQGKSEQTIVSLQKQLKQEADNNIAIGKVHRLRDTFANLAVLCRTILYAAAYSLGSNAFPAGMPQ